MSKRRPTTHLLKPGFIDDLRVRCGVKLDKIRKGDQLGTEDGLPHVDCAGCLRGLIVEMRLRAKGALGPLGRDEPSPEDIWLAGGDTGRSSKTIWKVMTGGAVGSPDWRPGIPLDPADFGRCHRLLEQFPAWRARLPEVAAKHPEWTRLVEAWDELSALYVEEYPTGRAPKLYARMQELTS
ncbi:MAG TPA: hypothetical protein VK509_20735 [Polyangiales bacterium]|nr:hypothetical protein [Polyangiales bacterium]